MRDEIDVNVEGLQSEDVPEQKISLMTQEESEAYDRDDEQLELVFLLYINSLSQ